MRESFNDELSPVEISKDPNDVDKDVVEAILEEQNQENGEQESTNDANEDAKCGKVGSTVGKIVAGATIPLYVAAVSHLPSALIRQYETSQTPQTEQVHVLTEEESKIYTNPIDLDNPTVVVTLDNIQQINQDKPQVGYFEANNINNDSKPLSDLVEDLETAFAEPLAQAGEDLDKRDERISKILTPEGPVEAIYGPPNDPPDDGVTIDFETGEATVTIDETNLVDNTIQEEPLIETEEEIISPVIEDVVTEEPILEDPIIDDGGIGDVFETETIDSYDTDYSTDMGGFDSPEISEPLPDVSSDSDIIE